MGATCASCTCNTMEQQTEYQIGIVSVLRAYSFIDTNDLLN